MLLLCLGDQVFCWPGLIIAAGRSAIGSGKWARARASLNNSFSCCMLWPHSIADYHIYALVKLVFGACFIYTATLNIHWSHLIRNVGFSYSCNWWPLYYMGIMCLPSACVCVCARARGCCICLLNSCFHDAILHRRLMKQLSRTTHNNQQPHLWFIAKRNTKFHFIHEWNRLAKWYESFEE